jgi:dTDP-4-dehydrorhamnose 3,5-epimerase-like enzyme
MDSHIADQTLAVKFSIKGLQFERNLVQDIVGPKGWFSQKLMSSPGPLISDFVTHEKNFRYQTYGIHVGQDDRLTFMGDNGKRIKGYFVDCRKGSATLHRKVMFDFAPSLKRRLIIPRGVAHTFDNLEYIVTRDEPVWYSDEDNQDWNIDNDLISVPRDTEPTLFPVVHANKHHLPDEAHQFLSRLSQSLLEKPKSYLARYLLNVGGKEKYVMFEPTSWVEDENELKQLLKTRSIPGVEVRRSRYALTGPRSWTLVPNTAACVADVLTLSPSHDATPQWFFHGRTKKWYTFLTKQSAELQVQFVDCRRNSRSFGRKSDLQIVCDPRISLAIENGIAYSFCCGEEVLVRCEHEVFVDENEPRTDIPPFGRDLMVLSADCPAPELALPAIRCPDSLVYLMAKQEVSGT